MGQCHEARYRAGHRAIESFQTVDWFACRGLSRSSRSNGCNSQLSGVALLHASEDVAGHRRALVRGELWSSLWAPHPIECWDRPGPGPRPGVRAHHGKVPASVRRASSSVLDSSLWRVPRSRETVKDLGSR